MKKYDIFQTTIFSNPMSDPYHRTSIMKSTLQSLLLLRRVWPQCRCFYPPQFCYFHSFIHLFCKKQLIERNCTIKLENWLLHDDFTTVLDVL